jgi:hypothetical protein
MHPTKKAAHIAGAVYLLLVLTAPFSLLYVPGKLIVRGNATATANNILTHETLFRLGIVADLFGSVIFICLGIALYRLLSIVNKTWARLMVALVLVSAAVGFVNVLNNIAALTLFRGGEFLTVIDKPQRDAMAYLFIRLHNQGRVYERDLLGSVALSLWAAGLPLRLSPALSRRLANSRLLRLADPQPYRLTIPAILAVLRCCFSNCAAGHVCGTGDHAMASD